MLREFSRIPTLNRNIEAKPLEKISTYWRLVGKCSHSILLIVLSKKVKQLDRADVKKKLEARFMPRRKCLIQQDHAPLRTADPGAASALVARYREAMHECASMCQRPLPFRRGSRDDFGTSKLTLEAL